MESETEMSMFFMIADATAEDAGLATTFIDVAVQVCGQPNPAMTHCEPYMFEQKLTDDNHFGQYLGQKVKGKLSGALWTSQLPNSQAFYMKNWAAVPVFAKNAAPRMREECDKHVGTPYPSLWTLFDYPWSVWPLRSFAGLFKSDHVGAPAHCAALSARILRAALPETKLMHGSHWYGPSSLYLELCMPSEMKRALDVQRPPEIQRSILDDDEDARLLDLLLNGSHDDIVALSAIESRRGVTAAAINVLIAGAEDERDETEFLKTQIQYARTMVQHTWVNRIGRLAQNEADAQEAERENAERELQREARELQNEEQNLVIVREDDVRAAFEKFGRN